MGQYDKNAGDISQTMRDAYELNNASALNIAADISKSIEQVQILHNTSSLQFFVSRSEYERELIGLINELVFHNQRMINYLSLDMDDKLISELDYVTLASGVMQQNLDRLIDIDQELQAKIIQTSNAFITITLLVLILFVGILIIMNYRYQTFQKKFVMESYKMVENHQFHFKELIACKPLFKEEHEIYNKVRNLFEEQQISIEAKNIVRNSYDMDKVLEELFQLSKRVLGINRIGISFIDYEDGSIFAEGAVTESEQVRLNVGYRVPMKSTSLSTIISSKKGMINNDLIKEAKLKPFSDSIRYVV